MTQLLPVWASLLRGLPVLLLHVAATTCLWLAGWRAACLLIPRGNASESAPPGHAHAVLSGAEALAFAVPLAACLAGSINVADLLLWGGVVVLEVAPALALGTKPVSVLAELVTATLAPLRPTRRRLLSERW